MVNQKSILTAVSYSCTLFLMKNCHYIDGIIFCSAGYGEAGSWKDCETTCNSKWMNIFGIALLLNIFIELGMFPKVQGKTVFFLIEFIRLHKRVKMLIRRFHEISFYFESNRDFVRHFVRQYSDD